MRGWNRIKKGGGGKSRNRAEFGNTALVRHSQGFALALRRRGRKFAAENFAEIAFFLFYRPQFQIDAAALFVDQRQFNLAFMYANAGGLDRSSTTQVQSASQPQQQRSLEHALLIGGAQHLDGSIPRSRSGLPQIARNGRNDSPLFRSVAQNLGMRNDVVRVPMPAVAVYVIAH